MCEDHGGSLHLLDYVGDAVGFSRSRDPEQCLMRKAFVQPGDELLDGLRLVAGGLVIGFEFERNFVHARSHAATRQRINGAVSSNAALLLKRKRGVDATGMVTSAPIP